MDSHDKGRGGVRGPMGNQSVREMVEERMLLSRLAAELTKLGVQLVTVEYPGFVNIPYPDGAHWAVGMANGPWGMTLFDTVRKEHAIGQQEFANLEVDDVPAVAVKVAEVSERERRERFTR